MLHRLFTEFRVINISVPVGSRNKKIARHILYLKNSQKYSNVLTTQFASIHHPINERKKQKKKKKERKKNIVKYQYINKITQIWPSKHVKALT